MLTNSDLGSPKMDLDFSKQESGSKAKRIDVAEVHKSITDMVGKAQKNMED